MIQLDTIQLSERFASMEGVDELSCYSWCVYASNCVAADYDKNERTCHIYRDTSCPLLVPALDRCCNHYSKFAVDC